MDSNEFGGIRDAHIIIVGAIGLKATVFVVFLAWRFGGGGQSPAHHVLASAGNPVDERVPNHWRAVRPVRLRRPSGVTLSARVPKRGPAPQADAIIVGSHSPAGHLDFCDCLNPSQLNTPNAIATRTAGMAAIVNQKLSHWGTDALPPKPAASRSELL